MELVFAGVREWELRTQDPDPAQRESPPSPSQGMFLASHKM